MKQSLLQTHGFPQVFSHLIADAMMTLPALPKEDEAEFLETVMGAVMNAFWLNYTSVFTPDINDKLSTAIETGDRDAMLEWYEKHADFKNDISARQRADTVLEDLQEKLPEVLKEEYNSFITHKKNS